MEIKTSDFGEVSVNDDDIVSFEGAIFGFEGYKEFVFLYEKEISEHFVWLQSIDDESLCFILVEPGVVAEKYQPTLPQGVEELLGPGDLMCWLIVVIKEDFEKSTVNLKSPIIVNAATRKACQIITEDDYSIQHPLIEKDGSDSKC